MELKDNGMIRFEVRNVTQDDLGSYRCHASNIYGYDNSIAQLNLESKRTSAAFSGLGAVCFVAKTATKSVHSILARASSSGQFTSSLTAVCLVESLILPMITLALLGAFAVFFSVNNLFGDSSYSFPCDDNLQRITEYIFKCDHN